MEYYDYDDWVLWPENDIREYAREIAVAQALPVEEAAYLEKEMRNRAGFWPKFAEKPGPKKLGPELEAMFQEVGKPIIDLFEENRRLNAPRTPSKAHSFEGRWEVVGRGLTRRVEHKVSKPSPEWRKEMRRSRRSRAKHPFYVLGASIQNLADDAMWAANCYPIGYGRWLIKRGNDAPFEGLVWYSDALLKAYENAKRQFTMGNTEAALAHAFRTGELSAELGIRLAHGAMFERLEAVRSAQQDAARARKTHSDAVRRETYWRYRNEGNKRIEAGRLAAEELDISESTLRTAFPGGRYPER